MRPLILATALAASLLSACAHESGATHELEMRAGAPNIQAALNDARRPADDVARDAARHPAETLAFAGVRPGARVADILPGGGYFTRLFAVAVGDAGRVYPVIRPEGAAGQYETPILPVAAQYPNVTMSRTPYDALAFPEPLDVVFTAQNYHDMPIADYHLGDRNAMNRTAFAALKPGGFYIVIDHSAVAGAPIQTAGDSALHRIDQERVRAEVEAAGFVFDGESDALRNPADTRTLSVFDPAIRGHTDQFMMRFRKPG